MPTPITIGKEIRSIDLVDIFPPNEGLITQYYGQIGSGKTYAATADILELLRRGKVVYANWRIHYEGTDERQSLAWIFLGILFPLKKTFYRFPKENLIYYELSDKWAQSQGYNNFVHWFSTRTDCNIFADEGHIMFDSYQGIKMSIDQRSAIYHTRHADRAIHIISQRPTSIHVSMRANVNKFYKCECTFAIGPFVKFVRTEFQDLLGETVDDNPEKIISRKVYWGKNRIFEAYDTKYLRGDLKPSQTVLFKAYNLNYFDKIKALFSIIFKRNVNIDTVELSDNIKT